MARRLILTAAIILTVTGLVRATDLTPADVVRAHLAGVSEGTLLSLIGNAEGVAPVNAEAESAMDAAGVPRAVTRALIERGGRPAMSTATAPDDPRLLDLVRLVEAGLSEDLVRAHIEGAEPPFAPTVNDLIFLKAQGVSDDTIGLLYTSDRRGSPPTAAPAVAAAAPTTALADLPEETSATPRPAPIDRPESTGEVLSYGPLLRYTRRAGMFPRDTRGHLLLGADQIQWVDDDRPDLSATFYASVLEKVSLECEKGAEGRVCHELKLKTVHGDTYRLRDPDWKAGENAVISAVYDALKTQYPAAKFKAK